MIDYNDKSFRPITASGNSETTKDTVFHYHQDGNIVKSEYSGGNVRYGHLIGIVDENGNIDMRYHQVNMRGELMTGLCRSIPEILPDGRIRLHERWRWTSGDGSEGTSVLEEI